MIRILLEGYVFAKNEGAKKMYAKYLSYANPYLFEDQKNG